MYCVEFIAMNGDACKHKYSHWLDAKRQIESIHNIYECQGYSCSDDEESWHRGWERTHVFTKPGRPDRYIKYYRNHIKL